MEVKNIEFKQLFPVLRKIRKLAGLSQNELAELAGVGKTLVFDLEKGHENIRFDNLRKILNVLNIKVIFNCPISLADLEEEDHKEVRKGSRIESEKTQKRPVEAPFKRKKKKRGLP